MSPIVVKSICSSKIETFFQAEVNFSKFFAKSAAYFEHFYGNLFVLILQDF